jgi:ankyrin repeat protein
VENRYGDDCGANAPLLFAAILEHHEAHCKGSIAALLDAGAKIDTIFTGLPEGGMDRTALMVACELKCCNEPLLELLQRGADVLQQTAVGFTALHRACQTGQPDKCKILVEANRRSLTLCADSKLSPLMPAVRLGHVPVLQLLHAEYGADLLVRDAAGGTLLHQMATVNAQQQQQQQ